MLMMYPIIMDTDFNRLAVIDDYISFIWTTRYYTSGDFELCVDVDSINVDTLKMNYYVCRDDDENVGIIEDIVIQRDDDGHEMLIAKGRFLASILSRRIIATQTTLSGSLAVGIRKLLNENIVSPTDTDRKIDNFVLSIPNIPVGFGAQYTGKNLMDVISDICQIYGYGFKVTLNASHQFVFTLFIGKNRTYDQTQYPWVIFSDEYDNLLSSEYEENFQNMTNAVLVAGEGEGSERKTAWATNAGATGLARRETFSDQRNIRQETMSDTNYLNVLRQAGKEKLVGFAVAFTGRVYFDGIKYREDVNIGDQCVIENKRWGIYTNSRLVEVIESVNEAGEYEIVPTFGI